MPDLADSIYHYYLDHSTDMPEDKRFHYASRLYLWCQDPAAKAILHDMRPYFTQSDDPAAAMQNLYRQATESPSHGSKNAAELRAPYFARYPHLKTYLVLLFRLCFLESIYAIDARQELFALCPRDAMQQLLGQLQTDPQATAILSTHAVNFAYLFSKVAINDENLVNPASFLDVAHGQYDHDNKVHLQLLIYLYTHCIIGDSRFYARAVPATALPVYHQMISELETLIGSNFDDINLDNKFEFLVCAKMVGIRSSLEKRINDEAIQSVSPDGTFLIDTLNTNPQTANTSLEKSEHRNVLFLMSRRDFTPLS